MKSNKQIRLLAFQNSVAFGGAEMQLISLLKGLLERGASVTLFTNEKEIIENLKGFKVRTILFNFPAKEMSGKLNFLKAIITLPYFLMKTKILLKEYIKKEKINTVYLPSFNEKVFITKIAKKLGLGVLWKEHGDLSWAYKSRNPFLLKIYKKSSFWADFIISPSEMVRERVLKYSKIQKEKSKTITNGIEIIEDKELSEIKKRGEQLRKKIVKNSSFVISFVSRITSQKGPGVIVEALKILKGKKINVFCFFVGEGPYEKELHKMINSSNVKNNIHFFGFLEKEKFEVISASDIFCFPTLYTTEGAPLAVPEALMIEKPVIASNIGGVSEVVKDKETGLLFEPGNARDLAEKIEYLINNQDLVKKYGRNGRTIVKNDFSVSVTAQQTLDLLNKTIRNI